jgi:hypothetical protein
MTDHEKPDFTVVDRRQTAQGDQSSPSETPTAPAVTPVVDVPEAAPSTVSSSSEGSDPDTGEDPFGMPDPALLIAMAAMQTSPQELLGLLAPAFDSQARRALGLIADTQTGELSPNMDAAKAAIDAVQFCLSRAEPTLDAAEYREMQRRLNDLRLTYVAKLQTS